MPVRTNLEEYVTDRDTLIIPQIFLVCGCLPKNLRSQPSMIITKYVSCTSAYKAKRLVDIAIETLPLKLLHFGDARYL